MSVPGLVTDRLVLRRWRDEDRAPFASLNADPLVARFMPGSATRTESDAWVDRIEAEFERDGFGLWAVAARDDGRFVGMTGLNRVPFEASFTPAVEIGWRLVPSYWGRGLATEVARAALRYGFVAHGLDAVVAETARVNAPSRRVMERLGMRHDPRHDFEHDAYPHGHPARAYVVYRLPGATFRSGS